MLESFIFQDYLQDVTVCDYLIDEFESNPYKQAGCVFSNGQKLEVPEYKRSVDAQMLPEGQQLYAPQLQQVVNKYIQKFPYCNFYAPWATLQAPTVQKYEPNDGFYAWHTERLCATVPEIASRHLVYMTYLNDVTDAGETEFAMQGLSVQPRKGLTLIWPADWTHTHRGVPSPTQTKYIATGWFCFTE